MVWWLLSRQIAWTSSKWIFKWKIRFSKVLMLFAMWFINCKEVVWMFVNNDNILLRISLALLIKLQKSCLIIVNIRKVENSQVNFQSNKNIIYCLKYLRGCLPSTKKFNHLVYNAFHIVENIFLVNGWLTSCLLFVNCLYESQQVVEMLQRSLIILFTTYSI